MSNTKKSYIDANIFIYPMLYEDDTSKACAEILLNIAKGEARASTSTLTWDELVYVIRKHRGKEISNSEGRKFLKFHNLKFLSVNEKILEKAQEIIEKYNVRPRDAIHIASAITEGADHIISDDSDFEIIKEIERVSPEKAIFLFSR